MQLLMGVSENQGYLILGVLIIRIPVFRVLYEGPLLFGNSLMDPQTLNPFRTLIDPLKEPLWSPSIAWLIASKAKMRGYRNVPVGVSVINLETSSKP